MSRGINKLSMSSQAAPLSDQTRVLEVPCFASLSDFQMSMLQILQRRPETVSTYGRTTCPASTKPG